jgi:hypothetical protein
MRNFEASDIRVQELDHCGIIAGICDEMGLVEQIDRLLGTHPQEIISPGQVVKAMILNGLGFVSAPLYLFETDTHGGEDASPPVSSTFLSEKRPSICWEKESDQNT